MKKIIYPEKKDWMEILRRPALNTDTLRNTVKEVLDKVKTEGDKAVREYEERFDKVKLDSLGVTETEIAEAEKEVPIELKAAIMLAQKNIHTFHSSQRFEGKKVQTVPGVTCWQKAVAIEKVGLYIPGGTAPLFSTVLMLATPAQIAGCKEIVLCTPPDKEGKANRKNNTKKLIFSVHIVNFPSEYLPITQKFTLGNEKAAFSAPSKKPDGSPSIG